MLPNSVYRAVRSVSRPAYMSFWAVVSLVLCMAGSVIAAPPIRLPTSYTFPADAPSSQSTIDTIPGSNTIVDLVKEGSDVWAATGRGASRYSESTQKWETFGTSDGLATGEISALHVVPGDDQIWVATSHSEVFSQQFVPFGDGLFVSLDDGITWVKRSPEDHQASGPFQICYDIASFRGGIAAACFAGGLVISDNDGESWTNIFASAADKDDFERKQFLRLGNRYFSLAVDSTLEDSLVLYAGSAAGIRKYIYLDSSVEITGHDCRTIAIENGTAYVATETGLSRTPDRNVSWRTFSMEDGLPTDFVGAISVSGDTIVVGADSVRGEVGAGLAYSHDQGDSWHAAEPAQALGSGQRVRSIVSAAGAWWAACERGGLIRSGDAGQSWIGVWPDTDLVVSFPEPPPQGANRINVLVALPVGDTTILLAGTDDGLLRFVVPNGAWPVRGSHHPIGEVSSQGLGQRILNLRQQDSPTDGLVLWSLNTVAPPNDERTDGYAISLDGGLTWDVAGTVLAVKDAAFAGDDFWLLTDSTLQKGDYPSIDEGLIRVPAVDTLISGGQIGETLYAVATEVDSVDDVPSLETLWISSDSGLAYFLFDESVWNVVLPDADPRVPDLIATIYYEGRDTLDTEKFVSLSGNFVTALEVQQTDEDTVIWAATRTTGGDQSNGISRSADRGHTWTVPITGYSVWNFAFAGDTVWAGSSEGLLHSPDGGTSWRTLSFVLDTISMKIVSEDTTYVVDTLNAFVDPVTSEYIDWRTEIFAVEVVGDQVWVGTSNGFARLDRREPATVLQVLRGPCKCLNCAYPSPFSPRYYPNGVRFCFQPPVTGPVTIGIYDFTNRLVREIRITEPIHAGVPHRTTVTWDGRNGKGDVVAIGTYFFVVEYANGDTDWGKIAVIH